MASRSTIRITSTDPRGSYPFNIQPDMAMLHPNYSVVSKLGEGGYGAVFDVIDRDNRSFAMKVQKVGKKSPTELQKEFEIYALLQQPSCTSLMTPVVPSLYGYKEHKGFEYLTMERLGDPLDAIMKKAPGKKLQKPDVLKVGIQVVRRLQQLHERGILHRDIKPNNLVMGGSQHNEKTVYIIDFGVSSIVKDWKDYKYDQETEFAGTTYYAPVEALYHNAPSRKGDLESLAYTLLHLACGLLDWNFFDTGCKRLLTHCELGVQRVRRKPANLCERFPELTNFVKIVRRMKPPQVPEYDNLISLLETALEELGSTNDAQFKWMEAAEVEDETTKPPCACPESLPLHDDPCQQGSDGAGPVLAVVEPVTPPGEEFLMPPENRPTNNGYPVVPIVPDQSHQSPSDRVRQCTKQNSTSATFGFGQSRLGTAGASEDLHPSPSNASQPFHKSSEDLQEMPCSSEVEKGDAIDGTAEYDCKGDIQPETVDGEPEAVAQRMTETYEDITEIQPAPRLQTSTYLYYEDSPSLTDSKGSCTEVPNLPESRRGRKRAFAKKLISKGLSRTVRAITGLAASTLVRIGGLRS